MVKNVKMELKVIEEAAMREAMKSGTFRAIQLENVASALRNVERENMTLDEVNKKIIESRSIAAGRADTMGKFQGYVLAQKVLLRGA